MIRFKNWESVTLSQQYSCKFAGNRSCGRGDRTFLICYVKSRIIWLCGWKPLVLNNHFAKFDKNRSCESKDTSILFCYVTSQDNMIKRTCDLLSGSPSSSLIILPNLTVIGLVEVQMKRFYFVSCHYLTTWSRTILLFGWKTLTLRNHSMEGEMQHCQKDMWLDEWEPFNLNHHAIKFSGCRPFRSTDITFLIV